MTTFYCNKNVYVLLPLVNVCVKLTVCVVTIMNWLLDRAALLYCTQNCVSLLITRISGVLIPVPALT